MKKEELLKKIETYDFGRGAWSRGVKEYAYEIVEVLDDDVEFSNNPETEKKLLNGASDWFEYSYIGCSLIYDKQIAERLCTPSELKTTRGGARKPNKREEWLDVQARALYQAFNKVMSIIREG